MHKNCVSFSSLTTRAAKAASILSFVPLLSDYNNHQEQLPNQVVGTDFLNDADYYKLSDKYDTMNHAWGIVDSAGINQASVSLVAESGPPLVFPPSRYGSRTQYYRSSSFPLKGSAQRSLSVSSLASPYALSPIELPTSEFIKYLIQPSASINKKFIEPLKNTKSSYARRPSLYSSICSVLSNASTSAKTKLHKLISPLKSSKAKPSSSSIVLNRSISSPIDKSSVDLKSDAKYSNFKSINFGIPALKMIVDSIGDKNSQVVFCKNGSIQAEDLIGDGDASIAISYGLAQSILTSMNDILKNQFTQISANFIHPNLIRAVLYTDEKQMKLMVYEQRSEKPLGHFLVSEFFYMFNKNKKLNALNSLPGLQKSLIGLPANCSLPDLQAMIKSKAPLPVVYYS